MRLKLALTMSWISIICLFTGCYGVSKTEYDRVRVELIETRGEIAQLQEELTTSQQQNFEIEERLTLYQAENTDLRRRLEACEAAPGPDYTPIYNIQSSELDQDYTCWNIGWDDLTLVNKIRSVIDPYWESHTYIEGETDFSEVTRDVWNMLFTQGITSIIAYGNLELKDEQFSECNHTWLMIMSGEGTSWTLECENGDIYTLEDILSNPQIRQYWEGFFYTEPSDLRADLQGLW